MAITPSQLLALSQVLQPPGREQMPWERATTTPVYDMFGSQDDDPMVRRSRELEHDRAQAGAELQARISDRRPWETPESIAEEVNLKYGLQPPGSSQKLDIVKSGSTILTPDGSGGLRELYRPDDKTQLTLDTSKLADIRRRRLQIMANPPRASERAAWDATISALDVEEDSILSKYRQQQPEVAPASPSRSIGFMGAPGGENWFQRGLERVGATESATTPKPSSRLREGQRVKNKRTGQMGTVVNGQIVPD